MHHVYLGLGSNLGNRWQNIQSAIENIEERIGHIVASSALYTTTPVGFVSDNQFLNAACHVQSALSPHEVLYISQSIERELGRKTKSVNHSYADRIIDIDVLMYDDLVINTPDLVLPHPHMHQRAFVLSPLAEIAGDVMHPLIGKTIDELNRLIS